MTTPQTLTPPLTPASAPGERAAPLCRTCKQRPKASTPGVLDCWHCYYLARPDKYRRKLAYDAEWRARRKSAS